MMTARRQPDAPPPPLRAGRSARLSASVAASDERDPRPAPQPVASLPADNSAPGSLAALDLYLRDLQRIPLLTAEQERALAQRSERGDRAAARALAQANLRLVVHIARHYLHPGGLPLDDLIADGNMGLLRAVEKYDWRRGYRFTTYAVWWIRQAVIRGIANGGRTIRLPVHLGGTLAQRERAADALAQSLGRAPTEAELQALIGARTPPMRAAAHVMPLPLSLDWPAMGDGVEPRGLALPDVAAVPPEEDALRRVAAEEMRRVLRAALTERERIVLTLRYGLEPGTSPETLQVVSRRVGLTRERVRQIEGEACAKLRDAVADWRTA